jgi:hypothetical protein
LYLIFIAHWFTKLLNDCQGCRDQEPDFWTAGQSASQFLATIAGESIWHRGELKSVESTGRMHLSWRNVDAEKAPGKERDGDGRGL